MSGKELEIFTDGACSGNPGPAGIGAVIREGGVTIRALTQGIGQATNNIAEYTALLYALQEALVLRADKVSVYSDSELMCRQIRGEYKIKNPALQQLFDQIQHLLRGIREFRIQHVPREQNTEADKLAREAIAKEQAKAVASPREAEGRKVRAPKDHAPC